MRWTRTPVPSLQCRDCLTPLQGRALYCVRCFSRRLKTCPNCAVERRGRLHRIPIAERRRQQHPCPICRDRMTYLDMEDRSK